MKIVKLLAGGTVIVVTYYVGKIVGEFKVIKMVADKFEEEFPGVKKYAAEAISKKVIDDIFDDTNEKKGEEPQ